MNEQNKFLLYLYKITDMGCKSTKTLVGILENKENKIINLLNDELAEYEKAFKDVKALIKARGIKEPTPGILEDIGISASMHMEIMTDNSDVRVAEMLIQGYTMGNLELTKKYNKYKKSITREEQEIVDFIKSFQDKNIKKLKKYI